LNNKQYAQENFIEAGTIGHTDAGFKEPDLPSLVVSALWRGGEAYITLGRLSSPDDMATSRHQPDQISESDVNRSAYYLIDDLQL
jgi:hypothetical protein